MGKRKTGADVEIREASSNRLSLLPSQLITTSGKRQTGSDEYALKEFFALIVPRGKNIDKHTAELRA